jgi:hypothetical protein
MVEVVCATNRGAKKSSTKIALKILARLTLD